MEKRSIAREKILSGECKNSSDSCKLYTFFKACINEDYEVITHLQNHYPINPRNNYNFAIKKCLPACGDVFIPIIDDYCPIISERYITENVENVFSLHIAKLTNNLALLFRLASKNNILSLMKQIIEIDPETDIHSNQDYAFCIACENGYYSIAKWLYSLGNININAQHDHAFRYACRNNHIEIARWLLEISPNIDVHSLDNELVDYAYSEWKQDIIDIITEYSPKPINKYASEEKLFRHACTNDNFEQARKILDECPDLNIHSDNEYLFRQVAPEIHFAYLCDPPKYGTKPGPIVKYKLIEFLTEISINHERKYYYYGRTAYIINSPKIHGLRHTFIDSIGVVVTGEEIINVDQIRKMIKSYSLL